MVDEEPRVEAPVRVAEAPCAPAQVGGRREGAGRGSTRRFSRPLADRGARDANEGDTEPAPTPAPPASVDVPRIRAGLGDAGMPPGADGTSRLGAAAHRGRGSGRHGARRVAYRGVAWSALA